MHQKTKNTNKQQIKGQAALLLFTQQKLPKIFNHTRTLLTCRSNVRTRQEETITTRIS